MDEIRQAKERTKKVGWRWTGSKASSACLGTWLT